MKAIFASVAVGVGLTVGAVAVTFGAAHQIGDLARVGNRALQSLPGVDTEYGVVSASDGARLRTIVTRPAGANGRLPAILFVQWLSCDSVDVGSSAMDGWSTMLRRLITESGYLVQRVDKSGVGDSTGTPCDRLDYETELAQHRAALDALLLRPDVDPTRVIIFGASMGTTYAPLVAAGHAVAGIMVWGGGATTWYERTLLFERHALELAGGDPARIAPEMTARAAFLERYLIKGESPATIGHDDVEMGRVWDRLVEAHGTLHYGRPIAFDQQAERQNWAAAWARVRAPVLVLYGEFDWFESHEAAQLIASIVNRTKPGLAVFKEVPATNHHFTRYPSREAAYQEQGGTVDVASAVDAMLEWLQKRKTS